MEIKDKVAVVTGGASRVGRSIVEALASAGARPVVHYHRSEDRARELALALGGVAVKADLSLPGGAEQLAAAALAAGGEVAVWVNSAAGFERAAFADADDALWRRSLELTLLAPAICARLAGPRMVEGGVIVNVLDVAAFRPWRGYAHHCVAKAALLMLTRCLALELAPRLRVCGVAPGLVVASPEMAAEERARLVRRIPLGREGRPADVARAVRFIVESDYVSGSVIAVDGGVLGAGGL